MLGATDFLREHRVALLLVLLAILLLVVVPILWVATSTIH